MEKNELEQLSNGLLAANGRVAALEYAVQVLIATHPDHAKLEHVWSGQLPERIESAMEQPAHQLHPAFREAMHQKLAELSALVDGLLQDDSEETS